MDIKYNRIKGMIYSKKAFTLIVILIVMCVISSYFIGCYFMAVEIFEKTPQIIDNLQLIYYKDVCLESSIIYVRET